MKVHGFFRDVLGANRVIDARRKLIESGSPENLYHDHIKEIAQELHPESTRVRVTKAENVSPTARRFTFEAAEGELLPPFQAGQYVSLDLEINGTVTTRPYSICSAPFEARGDDHPFFQITVRNGKPETGFAANWLYANVKQGDIFTAHLPFGEFYYEPLRDSKTVVALAGGSGITPFCSMAKEIAHGTLDMDLTILYGSVSPKDIILEDTLKSVRSDRVRLINVISGDEPYEGERGLLSKELIRKYSGEDTTYFVCGPLPMYRYVKQQLEQLNVPARRIRMEVFGAPRDVRQAEGYPKEQKPEIFRLTVLRGIQEDVIEMRSEEPIMIALERAGIPGRSRCRSGACGYCRAKLISGEVFVPADGDGRRRADKQFGYIHACSSWPLSDCTIRIPIL
ncbi:MAG: 2Fe-2S iron-sulfur cluster binding domain-containing protein [Solobacterium sp.]|nr:2Fe-2S iron-sulfur cluster binding domain-containing protein [Solobacterium sp.]